METNWNVNNSRRNSGILLCNGKTEKRKMEKNTSGMECVMLMDKLIVILKVEWNQVELLENFVCQAINVYFSRNGYVNG